MVKLNYVYTRRRKNENPRFILRTVGGSTIVDTDLRDGRTYTTETNPNSKAHFSSLNLSFPPSLSPEESRILAENKEQE